MSYKIIGKCNADHEPTFDGIADFLLKQGSRSGSLVRSPKHPKGVGLCVVMIGREAKELIGREYLFPILANYPLPQNQKISATPQTTIPQLMKAMQSLELNWGKVEFKMTDGAAVISCGAIIMLGQMVTDEMASELTKRGCMTKLR